VRGARLGRIEDSFDAPRDGGRFHDAVDILAARGTPVLSADDGTILRVGTNALGGKVVWAADSSGRFALYYAHLDRFARGLRDGRPVSRGQVIGYVGTTGNAPADVPHLHFQVVRLSDLKRYWDGAAVNPRPFLVAPEGIPTARRETPPAPAR
jgi:murein DD-endopeptidase MepM/ murein hydrolase activator NlpD